MTAFDAQASNNAHAAQQAMGNDPANSLHENPKSRTDVEQQLIETTFPQVLLGKNALRFTSDEGFSLPVLGEPPYTHFDAEAFERISQPVAKLADIDPHEAACAVRIMRDLAPFNTLPFFMACVVAQHASGSDAVRPMVRDICKRGFDIVLLLQCWGLMHGNDHGAVHGLPNAVRRGLRDAYQSIPPLRLATWPLTFNTITQNDALRMIHPVLDSKDGRAVVRESKPLDTPEQTCLSPTTLMDKRALAQRTPLAAFVATDGACGDGFLEENNRLLWRYEHDSLSAWECMVSLKRAMDAGLDPCRAEHLLTPEKVCGERIRPRAILGAYFALTREVDESSAEARRTGTPVVRELACDPALTDTLDAALSATAYKNKLKGRTLIFLPPFIYDNDLANDQFSSPTQMVANPPVQRLSAMEHIALTCAVLANSSDDVCIVSANNAGRYVRLDYEPSGSVLRDTLILLGLMKSKPQENTDPWRLESTLDTRDEFDRIYNEGMGKPMRILATKKECDMMAEHPDVYHYQDARHYPWDDGNGRLLPFDYPAEYMHAVERSNGTPIVDKLRSGDEAGACELMVNWQ